MGVFSSGLFETPGRGLWNAGQVIVGQVKTRDEEHSSLLCGLGLEAQLPQEKLVKLRPRVRSGLETQKQAKVSPGRRGSSQGRDTVGDVAAQRAGLAGKTEDQFLVRLLGLMLCKQTNSVNHSRLRARPWEWAPCSGF